MAKHTLKSCVQTARFLKYVWPFYNIMHERVNLESRNKIKFQKVVFKCPKYRESVNISWLEAKTQIVISLNEYLKQLSSN